MSISFGGTDANWTKLAPGLEHRTVRIDADEGPVDAHALRVDLKRAQIRVIVAATYGPERTKVDRLTERAGAAAVINGGFFDSEGRPLGLVITDGKRKSKWLSRDWGIFMIKDGGARIIHAREYRTEASVSQAIEVGPRLVVDGTPLSFKLQSARRSAVGIQRDGRVVLLAVPGSITLRRLAELMADPEPAGLACRTALHLDGGASSQMFIDTGKLKCHVKGEASVPTAIGVFP